jgi:hypothetical protein
MTAEQRHQAILAAIAARFELEIAQQTLKRAGVMQNANTLRRILAGKDCRLSTLLEAAEGVNCEVTIVITRKGKAA